MAIGTALDVSHWSGAFTRARLAAAKAAGATRLIVGTQNQGIATTQLEHARALGLEVQAYVYLYFATNVAERVRRDLVWLRQFGITRYWLDAEDSTAGLSQQEYVAALQQAVAACGDMQTGIYTGSWWWKPRTGDSAAFRHLPLWTAQYDGVPDLAVTLFGGWPSAAMKQFRPHASWGDPKDGAWFPDQARGVWCDVNAYELATALTPKQQEAVDYLRSADGQRLPASERIRILGLVGLSAMPGAPPPAVPSPPAAPGVDLYRIGYSAAARDLEAKADDVVASAAALRAHAGQLAANPPARK